MCASELTDLLNLLKNFKDTVEHHTTRWVVEDLIDDVEAVIADERL